jgi:excisionase family DNA binding protein
MRPRSEDDGPIAGEPPWSAGSAVDGQGPLRLLLTVNQAAERLTISRSETNRMIRRGLIPVVKIGRLTRIRPEALETFVDRLDAAS